MIRANYSHGSANWRTSTGLSPYRESDSRKLAGPAMDTEISPHPRTAVAPSREDDSDWRECAILAAITAWPSALGRYRETGAGLLPFTHTGIRQIARWMLMPRHDPEHANAPPELEAACCEPIADIGRTVIDALEARVAMLTATHEGESWALRDIDRHLAALAHRWLPESLRAAADELETNSTPHAITEAVRLLGWLNYDKEHI